MKIAVPFNYCIKISITQYAVGSFNFFLISLWEYIIYIWYYIVVFFLRNVRYCNNEQNFVSVFWDNRFYYYLKHRTSVKKRYFFFPNTNLIWKFWFIKTFHVYLKKHIFCSLEKSIMHSVKIEHQKKKYSNDWVKFRESCSGLL